MEFWSTLLYILLFIVFLSALIMVHEAGHLIAAKIFKVYCFEYSIGFGPKLFSKKRKKGETKFSLRAVPFGGFVSMYGEADAVPDGVETPPPERSLANIKRWKRIIILFAGVFMNAVLALVIFFCTNFFFTQTGIYGRQYSLTKDSFMYKAFLDAGNVTEVKSDDGKNTKYIGLVSWINDETLNGKYKEGISYSLLSNDGEIEYTTESGKTNQTFLVFLQTSQISSLNVDANLHYIPYTFDGSGKKIFDFANEITPNVDIKDMTYTLEYAEKDKPTKYMTISLGTPEHSESSGTSKLVFKEMKMTFDTFKYRNGFGTSVKQTFIDFGDSATAIVRGFAALFTSKEARESTSGIIGIGVISTQVLQNNGWSNYLYLWGLISVNLAIINLFPFPGLDGWHILVNIVEGITHKEIPSKVKGIISAIGLICLLVLMAVLVVSDIFKYLV